MPEPEVTLRTVDSFDSSQLTMAELGETALTDDSFISPQITIPEFAETLPSASATQLPEGYTKPTLFSTPSPEKLNDAVRLLLREVELLVGTDHYAHELKPGEKVIVAYQLVDRLCGPCGQALAFWAVHAAIQEGFLKAHRRFDTVTTKTIEAKGPGDWRPIIRIRRPLVPDFDPGHQLAGRDGMPAASREFDHIRRRYESFVLTFSPRQLPVSIDLAKDGPLVADCSRFRFSGTDYEFSPSLADAVKILWNAYRRGTPEVSTRDLIKDSGAASVAKLFEIKRNGKKITHEAFRVLIVQASRGKYRLAMGLSETG